MQAGATSFEGTAGRVAGAVMARLNRDMEHAAIDELDPAPGANVLSIGFGPGVGIAALVRRLPQGRLAGIDPSSTMVDQALRRNRRAVDTGQVTLACAPAESVPWSNAVFTGVLAVNSIQLWDPMEAGVREVARVLAPGGAFVSLTHVWAIEKHAPLAQWVGSATQLLGACGLTDVTHATTSFRSGKGLLLRASKAGLCNLPVSVRTDAGG
jgi:ubiquinone/menaquinone biosynthesis C-methylase UbiE